MYKYIFLLTLGLFARPQDQYAQPMPLNAAQVEAMVKTNKSAQLVDLRTPEEIQQTGKIEGAQGIDFYSPNFQAQVGKLDKNRPVIVYCATGRRSTLAAQQMTTQMGFKEVYNYTGGMSDWRGRGRKTVR